WLFAPAFRALAAELKPSREPAKPGCSPQDLDGKPGGHGIVWPDRRVFIDSRTGDGEEKPQLEATDRRRADPSMTHPQPNEIVLDLRGLRCPQPVLHARKALRTIPVGGTLVLECTDPLTVIDVPAFVNQTGHAISAQARDGELYI